MRANAVLVPWQIKTQVAIPADVNDPKLILPYAAGLREDEKQTVVRALQSGFYSMGAEFVWRRAISRLRSNISSLGMNFIGEMLDREDITDGVSADSVLTDFDTVRLAEALGLVNPTGAMRLRHAFELLSHFAGSKAEGTLHDAEAMGIIVGCVQYVLGQEDANVAVDFAAVRDKLLSEALTNDHQLVQQLITLPPFFVGTSIRVLLTAIKNDHGARLQHALANLNVLLPQIWSGITEADRWATGETYAEVSAAGKTAAVLDVKRALLKVKGFDYVPENLRSSTYRRAAQQVLQAHFGWDNFHTEPSPTRQLANLGTVIPKPAVADCLTAYLCVYMGNRYGHSFEAAAIAREQLTKVPASSWMYYLDSVLVHDENVLKKLTEDRTASRFAELIPDIDLPEDSVFDRSVAPLLKALEKKQLTRVRSAAEALLTRLKQLPRAA